MRGGDVRTGELFSYIDLEDRVRRDHPLRAIRQIVNDALVALEGDIAAKFLSAILARPKVKRLLSTQHFSVDGTLIEAWASMKSFRPKDGSGDRSSDGGGRNAEADFHGEKRSNETHASTTDPDARLYRKDKDKEAKFCFMGHGLMKNPMVCWSMPA